MKLSAGIAAAFASCATAAASTGQAYTFPSVDSSSNSLSSSLARLILLQRLAPSGSGPSIHEKPDNIETDEVISLLNTFGATDAPLFSNEPEPRRLLVLVDGMTEGQLKQAAKHLGTKPSFSIADAPSTVANEKFFEQDIYGAGVTNQHKCSLDEILKLTREECWSGQATASKFSADENEKALDEVLRNIKTITKLAKANKVQSTIVLLPKTEQNVNSDSWVGNSQELRRRQAEQVMASQRSSTASAPTTSSTGKPSAKILACYSSVDECNEATNKCSNHGECRDKYASGGGDDGDDGEGDEKRADDKDTSVCFACHCLGTQEGGKNGSVTYWGGPTCAKQDVSTPFWLFFGITIVLVGTLTLSIGLLYTVGEEKLPGVIGAGVSKAK